MPGRMSGRAIGFGVPLAAVAILAAACGGSTPAASGTSTSTAVAPAPSSPATTTTTPAPTPAPTSSAGPAMALTTETGGYGTWLADQAGRTLYVLSADKGTTSSCYGACATAWPPLLATGAVTASGAVVAADLGTTARTDGTTQVTYAGHPLYYFARETGADQVLGLGAQGVWFLVAPAGTMIKPVPMAPPRMAPPPMTRPHMMPPPMTRPRMMPPPMTKPGM